MIVTLTPRSDFFPVPRVEIEIHEELIVDGGEPDDDLVDVVDGGEPGGGSSETFDGGSPFTVSVTFPDSTDSVTVLRSSEGRQMKVRGVVGRVYAGATGWVDLEAGFDVESTYVAECYGDGILLGRVNLGSVTLPWEGPQNGVVIQQPLDPRLNVTVVNLDESWPQLVNNATSDIMYAEGADRGVLIGSGPRLGYEDVAIDFGVTSIAEARQLRATLGTQTVQQLQAWLIRSPAGFLPRVFFARVGQLAQVDFDYRYDGEWSRFQASVTEIEPPAPALVLGTLSYDDLDVSYASYDDRDAAYVSYDEMDRDWSLTGAAGGA